MIPEDIDPSLCTHVMYGFATLDTNTLLLKTHDTWADIDNSKLLMVEFECTEDTSLAVNNTPN